MIPKIEIISLPDVINNIFTVPANKVIEIHDINVHNQTIASRSYFSSVIRASLLLPFRNAVAIAPGDKSTTMSANKKAILMDGDIIRIDQSVVPPGPPFSTASLHYTEWDVGEIPGVEPKSVFGTIVSDTFVTALSTSIAVPRLVIRDYLVQSLFLPQFVEARLHTSTIDNLVENLSIGADLVDTSITSRWVLEQKGATVMDWQHRARPSGIPAFKFLLSYIEHLNV